MANPAERRDGAVNALKGQVDAGSEGRAADQTRTFSPNMNAEVANAVVLDDLESLSVAVPAHLGKYEIQGQIGHGGMGVVWKGFDPVPSTSRSSRLSIGLPFAPSFCRSTTAGV